MKQIGPNGFGSAWLSLILTHWVWLYYWDFTLGIISLLIMSKSKAKRARINAPVSPE